VKKTPSNKKPQRHKKDKTNGDNNPPAADDDDDDDDDDDIDKECDQALEDARRKAVAASLCECFYAPQLVPAGTAEARISYGNSVCPSVCLSVCLSVRHNPVVYQAQVR